MARQTLKNEKEGSQDINFGSVPDQMDLAENSMKDISLEDKVKKINEIENFTKALGDNVENVSVSLSANVKDVQIITADGDVLTRRAALSEILNIHRREKYPNIHDISRQIVKRELAEQKLTVVNVQQQFSQINTTTLSGYRSFENRGIGKIVFVCS